jgi:putative SOS response-associated peptidase YedK
VPVDFYPGYVGPFIRRAPEQAQLDRDAQLGRFGLFQHWSKDLAIGRRTYNARSETADSKPSSRDAWRCGQRCIIPAEAIYEPCWETGKAVRWRIERADGAPMEVAGLWGHWRDPKSGTDVLSYSMLTVNADGHAIFTRMHRPEDEKRMVVILDEADYQAWLNCPPENTKGFMRRFPAERLRAKPWPKPSRLT